jgi:glycosyltransferase involved in cell wall biosynthesis
LKLVIYIPTYNRLEKLKVCIESIASQVDGINVYVSNNASTDGTKEYLDGLNYSWLMVYHQPENYGAAFNHASAWYIPVDAEYIWVIGDDDYLLPNAVQTLLEATEHKTDFIFCNTQAYDAKREASILRHWEIGLPPGNIKGKHAESFLCNFSDLIDPKVADSLLLEIMCLCVRKSAVKTLDIEHLKIEPDDIFEDVGKHYTGITTPLFESFHANTKSFYLQPPLTFNFWSEDKYSDNYDYIFPIAILYMIEMYKEKSIIDNEKYLGLLSYYFNSMGYSIFRQDTGQSKAKPFGEKISRLIKSRSEMIGLSR